MRTGADAKKGREATATPAAPGTCAAKRPLPRAPPRKTARTLAASA